MMSSAFVPSLLAEDMKVVSSLEVLSFVSCRRAPFAGYRVSHRASEFSVTPSQGQHRRYFAGGLLDIVFALSIKQRLSLFNINRKITTPFKVWAKGEV